MPRVSHQAPPRLRFAVAAEPPRLLRARDRVRDYLARHCADQTTVDDVVLAVEEACTNAIRHSGSQEEIEIRLGFEGDRLLAAVRDQGHGFDINGFDPDRLPDVSSDHGRGLFLIASLCDKMELRYAGGLEVVMVKRGVSFCEAAPLESGLGDVGVAGPLAHREARTRALLEDIDEGFVALDWEYRYVHANEAALSVLGLTREELLGRRPWDIWPRLTGTPTANALREAMELGKPSVLEARAIGTGIWLEERFYPTAAGVSAYLRAIDDRKRIEHEVVASRAELAATLAAITDGFYTLDRAWRVTFLNDRAAAVFPAPRDEVLGADFWALFPEAVGSDFETNKRRAMEHGEHRSFESYYPPFDTWFEERDYPSKDGITVLFTDISVRKRAEAERDRLLQTTSLLLEAARAGADWTDLDQMLESLGDLLRRSTDHARVVIELWDDERREVEVAVSKGSAAIPKRRFAFDDVSEAARSVITSRRTVVIDYARTARSETLRRYLDEHRFLLLLAVPIVYRERLVGLIMVDQPGERRPFGKREIQVVEAIAGQAGVAIENARLFDAVRESGERLSDVLDSMTDGFVSVDRDWHYMQVNPAAERMLRKSAAELLGRRLPDVFPDINGLPLYFKAMEERVPVVFEVYSKPTDAWVEVHAYPTGSGLAIFVTEISARKAAEEERLRLLEESRAQARELARRTELEEALNAIEDLIHSTLRAEEIMQRVVARAVEAVGSDSAMVALKRGDDWIAEYGYPEVPGVIHERVSTAEAPFIVTAVTERRPVAIDDCATDPRCNPEVQRRFGVRSVLCIPLLVRDEILGVIFFNHHRAAVAFTPETVEFSARLAVAVSSALENARLYEAQLHIATILQENLVHPLPGIAGLELATLSLPAGREELVGGDFCDVIARPDGVVVALIGDVTGKGIEAAGFTETVRAAVRTLALISPSPQYILGNVNRLLLHEGEHRQLATALLVTLDPRSGQGFVASAGHPPPVRLCETGCRVVEPVYGLPLGVLDWGYEATSFALAPGEALVLYTDGVTEARRDGELFGERRLLEALGAHDGREPLQAHGTPQRDDARRVDDAPEAPPARGTPAAEPPAGALQLIERLQQTVIDYADELRDDLEILALRRTK